MKSFLFVVLIALSTCLLSGQTITGTVFDTATNEPLVYVSIGIVGQPRGTITDENGTFELETAGLTAEATVRFSMIGFVAQTFTIKELSDNNGKIIKLENAPVRLSEVVIKPKKFGKPTKVGVTKFTKRYQVCGWSGDNRGRGQEIGTNISLGPYPACINKLHFYIRQAYDSCLFRLHIREITDGLPGREMLDKNIIMAVTQNDGWVEIDLEKYGLVYQGDVVVSLEWVKVMSLNTKKLIFVNGKYDAGIIFPLLKDRCCYYDSRGSEAHWIRRENHSPPFYLTVKQAIGLLRAPL